MFAKLYTHLNLSQSWPWSVQSPPELAPAEAASPPALPAALPPPLLCSVAMKKAQTDP